MASPLLSTNADLKWALNDYETRTGAQSQQIEYLPGTGNESYRIDFAEASIALRINGSTEYLGVDRQSEQQVLNALAGTGIAPQTRLWHEKYLAVDFIQNKGQADPAAVADTLRKLHQHPVPTALKNTPSWTPAQTVRSYFTHSNDSESLFSDHLVSLEGYNWSTMTNAICHCDLNPNNILQPTTGGAVFIDWEYARYGPLAYDVAVYAQTHNFDSRQLNDFLRHYPDAPAIEAIAVCRYAYKIIEVLWLIINEPLHWPIEKIRPITERLSAERSAFINNGTFH